MTSCPPPNATGDLRPGGDPGSAAASRLLRSKSADAAQRAGQAILGTHPRLGRPVEYLPEAFREWLIDFGDIGYAVRYCIADDAVTILAIRHQKEAGYS